MAQSVQRMAQLFVARQGGGEMDQDRFPSFGGLKSFYALALTGSAVKAAARLGVSPSSISHQVKALEKEMGVMLAGVFNSGILATGAVPVAHFEYAPAPPEIMDRVRKIEAICAAHGTSIRRAALQFSMAHPAVVAVVLGAVRPEETQANAADAANKVPAGLWSDLKSAGLLDPAAPTPGA